MAHLKVSELQSFLLFYGLPCLWGLLAYEYFQHFLLLVDAVFILLQDSISPEQLTKSASLLHHFCLKMESLYGKRYETFNVHCLLHLVPCVENLGPVWASSWFWYEDIQWGLEKSFPWNSKCRNSDQLSNLLSVENTRTYFSFAVWILPTWIL